MSDGVGATDRHGPATVAELLSMARRQLALAGIEGADRDGRVLLASLWGKAPAQLGLDPGVVPPEAVVRRFRAALARRAAREPVSRILGRRGFWDMDVRLNAQTLDPRPDTETLVEAALEAAAVLEAALGRPLRILDLGTGSGCILIALLRARSGDQGLGIDISPDALAMARQNAREWGVGDRASFQNGDWVDGLTGFYDLIVSNPPYIPSAEIEVLDPEVRDFDPRAALDGGVDGLDPYRRLVMAVPSVMDQGAVFAVEFGFGQGNDVCAILQSGGFSPYKRVLDLAGKDRVVLSRLDR